MIIICWLRGLYLTFRYGHDFIPISGHEGQEQKNGDIICMTCGHYMGSTKPEKIA